jgi:hypothetical protein
MGQRVVFLLDEKQCERLDAADGDEAVATELHKMVTKMLTRGAYQVRGDLTTEERLVGLEAKLDTLLTRLDGLRKFTFARMRG